jgi:superfamily II DNA or RNA helicase
VAESEGQEVNSYEEFLQSKVVRQQDCGFAISPGGLNPMLFPFQRDLTAWALRRGRAALFEDCGLGKTPQQLEWARRVHLHTGGDVLILAPLAVAQQTAREGAKFGIPVTVCQTQSDVRPGVNVTNYEKLHHFAPAHFSGVVLDESSILKSFTAKTCRAVVEAFAQTPYRLACTATPAPNDYMELGNHAEFLGVMSRTEMLSMFFTHDGGNTSQWRLKRHAEDEFWRWVASWAAFVRKPSDIGHDDAGFALPELKAVRHALPVDRELAQAAGMLFPKDARTLTEQRETRGASLSARVAEVASLVNGSNDSWVVWCELNDESSALAKAIEGAAEVRGSDSNEKKEAALADFAEGRLRVLVSKPSIAGFGMNWQHCHRVAFVGVSHSYEQTYQAIRRCWRFGQTHPVEVHTVYCETEDAVVKNLERKAAEADRLAEGMLRHMGAFQRREVCGAVRDTAEYAAGSALDVPAWLRTEAA